jgi:predicted glycosyltransferase
MSERLDGARVLIYSHDTFGLGHLRRCRTIAHSLVEQYKGLSVLILSGSPIIGSFDFRARVDFVRVPGVIKLRNAEYTTLSLHIDIEHTLAMRASIIQHTASTFAPDLFLVDKEPLGLKGEVVATLEMLKARGTRLVLGLRDVMDEPSLLRREWERKNVMPALAEVYDEIWVFGLERFGDPLAGLRPPEKVRCKTVYTGYLPRLVPQAPVLGTPVVLTEPYLLVTAGGGGDGAAMIDWVLRAYEVDPALPYPALLVFGPFMPPATQKAFQERVARLERVQAITFDSHIEILMERAAGVVAMAGYNTFCEILSLDKRALLIPRCKPRLEQRIRATRAQQLGLAEMLDMEAAADPRVMAGALHRLPAQRRPSQGAIPGLLEGLHNIDRLVGRHIGERRQPGPDLGAEPEGYGALRQLSRARHGPGR